MFLCWRFLDKAVKWTLFYGPKCDAALFLWTYIEILGDLESRGTGYIQGESYPCSVRETGKKAVMQKGTQRKLCVSTFPLEREGKKSSSLRI